MKTQSKKDQFKEVERAKAYKPSNIVYDVDEKPPLTVTLLQGLQHICIFFVAIVMPVAIINQLGDAISLRDGEAFISLSLLSGGVVTIVQAMRKRYFGSGYLCPAVCGPSYFDATKHAALTGGLPMIFGMTALAGVLELIFSRIMHKLRRLFPAEVTGLAVTMVGVVVIPISIRNFFAVGADNTMGSPNMVL
ncbi:xanthine permease, partial [candidate division KSB1 bacterium]|nr:xanthine permease [candidate division KSB1 bacterium]